MLQIQSFRIAFETGATLFAVIAAISVFSTRSFRRRPAVTLTWMLALDAVMNIVDITMNWTEGTRSGLLDRILPMIMYLCAFLFIYFTLQHAVSAIHVREGREDKKLTALSGIAAAAGMITNLASWSIPSFRLFEVQNGHFVIHLILGLIAETALLPILLQALRNRKSLRRSEFIMLLSIYCLMSAGFLLQMVFQNFLSVLIAYALSLILIVLTHQMGFSKDNLDRERELAKMQMQLYTRQIQPHFIYNSLSAIRSSLPEESQARESLNHFAGFMRGSVDLLTAEGCIKAGREFATVRDYLYMEKLRFEDALTVKMDIRDEDFELPPFTVQTLVENAVRYGIRENPKGRGTLEIRSYRDGMAHIIEVRDDGVGFDPGELKDEKDDRAHIGLENIRKRLEVMCSGTFLIDSAPGKGTLATVKIPIQ